MTEKITTDLILSTMKEWVETHNPVAPSTWVDAALKLNVLMGDETDRLYDLEHAIALKKAAEMEGKKTAAHADTIVRASEEYKDFRKQQARVKRIEEFIRIAKKQASLRDAEMSGY